MNSYKHLAVFITFIFSFNVLQAQESQPSKTETLDWIQSKMLSYASTPSCGSLTVDANNVIKIECESQGALIGYDTEYYKKVTTTTLSLNDVTSFEFGNSSEVILYSKEKKVRVKVFKDYNNSVEESFVTRLSFTLSYWEEENLKSRFTKALKRLVELNTNGKAKEIF